MFPYEKNEQSSALHSSEPCRRKRRRNPAALERFVCFSYPRFYFAECFAAHVRVQYFHPEISSQLGFITLEAEIGSYSTQRRFIPPFKGRLKASASGRIPLGSPIVSQRF